MTVSSGRVVLDRTLSMIAFAESVDATTSGAAGLAYQAAELAVHVMLMEIDGHDPWDDAKRYSRASEVLGIDVGDFGFLHQVRMRDFTPTLHLCKQRAVSLGGHRSKYRTMTTADVASRRLVAWWMLFTRG